jgi:hypothetical protein
MNAEPKLPLPIALRAIANITVLSGALQMVKPGWVLGQLSPRPAPLAGHLFGTVGMFIVVCGGTLHRSLAARNPDPGLLAWAALQKLGASAAVDIGVRRQLSSPRALIVAAFDLASSLGCLIYARQLRRTATGGDHPDLLTVRSSR